MTDSLQRDWLQQAQLKKQIICKGGPLRELTTSAQQQVWEGHTTLKISQKTEKTGPSGTFMLGNTHCTDEGQV